jgi:hypothetical protein
MQTTTAATMSTIPEPPHTMEYMQSLFQHINKGNDELQSLTGEERAKHIAEYKTWIQNVALPALNAELKYLKDNPGAVVEVESLVRVFENQVTQLNNQYANE